nr:metallopeptidase family protein [uncultured Nocardioides sp.]
MRRRTSPGEGEVPGRSARTSHYGRAPGTLPDTITLYRNPILAVCEHPEDVAPRVRKVLVHEVGHAMGIEEDELRALGWH